MIERGCLNKAASFFLQEGTRMKLIKPICADLFLVYGKSLVIDLTKGYFGGGTRI